MGFLPGMATAMSNPGTWSAGVTPTQTVTPGVDWSGTAISAGSQAAATTAQLISQAAAAQAQRDAMTEQSGLDRATREKLARMQLQESARQANANAKANAYKMLLSAFSNQMGNEDASYAGKRNSNVAMDQLLASAMLRRR